MKRVLVADDHEIIVSGLARWLQEDARLEVVAVARDGDEALEKARTSRPDIVILDHPLPLFDTRELIAELHSTIPSVQIVIYSMQDRAEVILELLRVGAAAYVLKSDPAEHLPATIASLTRQSAHLSPGASRALAHARVRNHHLRAVA